MFKQLAVLLAVLVITGCAGRYQPEISYTKVLDVPKFEKSQVFNRSEEWIALSFNSGKSVIQVKNPETGRIIGRGVVSVSKGPLNSPEVYNFTMVIDAKDDKARIQFLNFTGVEHGLPPAKGMAGRIETQCMSMAYSLKDHIKKLSEDYADW